MKKALGIVCGLTILSACSMFEDEKPSMASDSRRSPMMNNGGGIAPIAAPMAIDDPMARSMPPVGGYVANSPMGAGGGAPMAMPVMPPMGGSMPMEAPEPPVFGNQVGPRANPVPGVVSTPLTPPPLPGQSGPALIASASDSNFALKPASSAMPVMPADAPLPPVVMAPPAPPAAPEALPSERRMPEFNREALQQNMQAGNTAEYPKLAQVPPAPPVKPSLETDPRVAAMREDLARMEGGMPAAPAPIAPKIVSKTEIKEGVAVPPAPVASAPLPVPPAPPMVKMVDAPPPPAAPAFMAPPPPPGYAVPPAPPAPPASTNLADLKPLGAPAGTLPRSGFSTNPAPVNMSAADPYTDVNSLQPLSGTGHYRTLPSSRYEKYRAAARNNTRSIIQ